MRIGRTGQALQFVSLAGLLGIAVALWAQAPQRIPDVPYVPTSTAVVDAMLDLAEVDSSDVVYDLGCGDGRIIIAAARQRGARGFGVDINPDRIADANRNAEREGVTGQVRFEVGDFFETDIKEATVVMLYLMTRVNEQLKPKLLSELAPGTKVVSNTFDFGEGWDPVETRMIDGRRLMLFVVPER